MGSDYAVEGTTCSVAFSALKGNTIEFRDSIFIASAEDTSVIFNGDLNGDGGDIIFTGASTETDLRALKGSAGTASEILNSRTSEVQALTQLCGGRLCVEDGAIYKGYGITAIAGSQATVRLKDATLSHKGYNLTFNAGTTLDLVGVNVAESQQMLMMDGSVWSFEVSADNEDNALLSYSGSLTLGGRLDIQITGSEELEYGEYKLMTVQGTAVSGWDDANISINGGDISTSDVEWVRGTLYFSYTGQDLSTPEEDPDEPIEPNEPISPENPEPLQPIEPSNSVLTGGFIDEKYEVILNNKGNIVLEGEVNAGAITVESDKNITLKINKKNPGALVGDGDLTKSGLGTLTLNDGNVNWTGDIYLKTGTIKVSGATSMGLGDVYVQGGALDLKSKAVSNDIVLEGSAAVKGGKKYAGEFTMNSGELLKGSLLNIAEGAELKGGVVNGTLSGVGTVEVTGDVALGSKGKVTTSVLDISGKLDVSSKGLSMNSKVSAIEIDDGTLSSAGKISAYSLSMEGGKLDVTNAKPMGITLKGAFEA
ncbi:MAG: hypothetical protein Q4A24_08940, partial [Akkermansia sp.]|nr:hypothetical protein [Akkermansia sp.]